MGYSFNNCLICFSTNYIICLISGYISLSLFFSSLWHIFSCFISCLVIIDWIISTVNFTMLRTGYFCIPLNLLSFAPLYLIYLENQMFRSGRLSGSNWAPPPWSPARNLSLIRKLTNFMDHFIFSLCLSDHYPKLCCMWKSFVYSISTFSIISGRK